MSLGMSLLITAQLGEAGWISKTNAGGALGMVVVLTPVIFYLIFAAKAVAFEIAIRMGKGGEHG
jgi:hypothetical protein